MTSLDHGWINGRYYDGKSNEAHPARLRLANLKLELQLVDASQATLHFAPDEVDIASRLGNTTRTLRFRSTAAFESDDNDAIDIIERALGRGEWRAHFLESNVAWALGALITLMLVAGVAWKWGVPWAAKKVAFAIPEDIAYRMGEGSLETLDKILFEPSQLPTPKQKELHAGFAKMAAAYPELPLHLEFRSASMPNAFALPNGTVVVTDELLDVVESDAEVYAVLAHEIGHVEHRHAARLALEGSVVGLFVMVVFGDASQAAGLTATLPAVYANAAFSREHETEADTFALQYMRRAGLDPGNFALALKHLTKEAEGQVSEPQALQYLSSHPATASRIARFTSAAQTTQQNEK